MRLRRLTEDLRDDCGLAPRRRVWASARDLESLRGRAVALRFFIAKRLNVVFVSHQLGHHSPTITLDAYAHLFEQADHAAAAREALEASYAAMVGRNEITNARQW